MSATSMRKKGRSFGLGVALAMVSAALTGTAGNDNLAGTDAVDAIYPRGQRHRLRARGQRHDLRRGGQRHPAGQHGRRLGQRRPRSRPQVYIGPDRDGLYGADGDDAIYAANDGAIDFVNCGAGNDTAYVDSMDLIERISPTIEGALSLLTSCERVRLL